MNVNGRHYRTIWLNRDGWAVDIINQTNSRMCSRR